MYLVLAPLPRQPLGFEPGTPYKHFGLSSRVFICLSTHYDETYRKDETTLKMARILRDRVLKSWYICSRAQGKNDVTRTPSLDVRVRQLDDFVKRSRDQQDIIVQ